MSHQEIPAFVWDHRLVLLAVYFSLIFAEIVWRGWTRRSLTSPLLLVVNVTSWLMELALRAATFGLRLWVFVAVASLVSWKLPSSLLVAAPLYVGVDFLYYWKHRLMHTTGLGWGLHAVHHGSDQLTLLAAIRLGWIQRLIDDLFFVPLLLLGPAPMLLFLLVDLNESQQFWCHTEAIGRLGFLDGIFNTPANHRVHHARERVLSSSNYGAQFILWDRLFGTWRRADPVEYGVPEGNVGLNLLVIQFAPLWRWAKGG